MKHECGLPIGLYCSLWATPRIGIVRDWHDSFRVRLIIARGAVVEDISRTIIDWLPWGNHRDGWLSVAGVVSDFRHAAALESLRQEISQKVGLDVTFYEIG